MTPEVGGSDLAGHPVSGRFKIYLALSGGGFRAAIFHLGVIRRLEELGIMKDVDAISCVSGGSIVAAYYVCEMERRLRQVHSSLWGDPPTRVGIFESIAKDFLRAVDHNLRTRALIFTPFFHPILFVKTLFLKAFRPGARAELIQREYDKWFYDGDTVDQLPSVTPEQTKNAGPVLLGPQVIMNTTSLLTGERIPFSREPNSGMTEMKRSNKNSLPLSRVVGASSGVPIIFPPTHIFGDLLVDGGVADNQGIEALLVRDDPGTRPDRVIVLVSDASGQLEAVHNMGSDELKVFFRVNDILQFQVRSKLIDRLVDWKESAPSYRYFAFIHLYLNLKDRGTAGRLPAEMIPGVARIRTDLDQFSLIERDALMYHGYTLIDAQIQKYCWPLATAYPLVGAAPLRTPALMEDVPLSKIQNRDFVRNELEAGANKAFLLRSLRKYPKSVIPVFIAFALALAFAMYELFNQYTRPLDFAHNLITATLKEITSGWIGKLLDWLLGYAKLPPRTNMVDGLSSVLAASSVIAISAYVLMLPTYMAVRRVVMGADRRQYLRLTGGPWSVEWREYKAAPTTSDSNGKPEARTTTRN